MKLHSLTALTTAVLAMFTLASCGESGPKYGDPAVKVSPSTMTFTSDGGSNTVQLTATVAWTVENTASWITVSPNLGDPSKEVQTVTVSASKNSDLERSATVTFKAADGSLSSTLTVSQDAYKPTEITDATAAAFNNVSAYKYQQYRLTGTVKNLKSDGTFDLVDATGTVIVKGLNASDAGYGAAGGKLDNVKERDTVTIVGYKETADGKSTLVYAYVETVNSYSEPSADSAETVAFPFSANFTKETGKFIVRNEVFPYAFDAIWSNTSYGWTANAYKESQNYATESWLISPKINMSGAKKPILVFTHVVNYFASLETAKDQTSLYVRVDGGDWKQVAISFSYPDELSSEQMTSEDISLSDYIGKTIQFAFKYISTEDAEAGMWQIADFNVKENEEKAQDDNTGGTQDYNKPGWEW